MSRLSLDISQFDDLQKAMKEYEGNTEQTINDVLHNEAGQLIHDAIKPLIPSSGKEWKGKKTPARVSNSLQKVNENLAVTIKSKKDYNYLYFPDDGTNTRRHIGNQQFFRRGGESQTEEIIDRCIIRLVSGFETIVN